MPKGATPGKGAPREKRRFDQTYLSVENCHMVHRDYGAHYFRWGFAHRMSKGKRVLDVGCGPDFMLGRVLQQHGNMGIRASKYVGVDLSKIPCGEKRTKLIDLWPEFSFVDRWKELRRKYGRNFFDVAFSFEVIEHMEYYDGIRLLSGMAELAPKVVISTPRNEGRRQARNHLHEYSGAELENAALVCGLRVVERYGTFGDVTVVRKALGPEERLVWDRLSRYYSDDVMSCFLAPLYPDASKNNLWVLEREE